MSLDHIAVTLLAEHKNQQNITRDQFVSRLSFDSLRENFTTRSDAGSGITSAVTILPISVEEFVMDNDEIYESFYKRLNVLLLNVTVWLSNQPQSVFNDMRENGLRLWLFINIILSDNQIELHLLPDLMSVCARLGLEIDINSY
jgi:hypothetical protein